MAQSIFILGGAKSGKSGYALAAAESLAPRRVFVATAQAYDSEMRERIARHQEERGPSWRTVEEPLDISGVLRRESRPGQVIVVDCLTLWLSNLMTQEAVDKAQLPARFQGLAAAVEACAAPVILVANEVGLGIVPENALARAYRDQAGALNQLMAKTAGRVVFVAAGLPLMLKGDPLGLDPGPGSDGR